MTSAPVKTPPRSLSTRGALLLFNFVQALRRGQTPACRYLPSCSAYALEAVEVHGAWKGTWLALRRVGRCHPWGSHGYDPVPPSRSERGTPLQPEVESPTEPRCARTHDVGVA